MTAKGLGTTPIFWGCTITHNFPFLMDSTRTVLEKIGLQGVDIPEVGCCPDPVYLKTQGDDFTLSLSARNLALARKLGPETIVACNGCYNVLHHNNKRLMDPKVRERINSFLPDDLQYEGTLRLTHILHTLSTNLPALKEKVTRPLGLKVAVHYGCHALYPEAGAAVDQDPKNPSSMDMLVKACGCESVDYPTRLDCCGVSIIAFDMKESNRILGEKFSGIKETVDCIVTACPACFMRFDIPPPALKDQNLPVIHLSELLALAMGTPREDIFFEGHMTDVSPVLEKIGEEPSEMELVRRNIDPLLLDNHCGACSKECTMAIKTRDSEVVFDPMKVVHKLREGRYREVLEGQEIWMCLQCGHCEENCPSNASLIELFARLRELALENMETPPRAITDKLKTLGKTGFAMPKKIGIRKKMGIDPAPEIDVDTINAIIEKVRKDEEDVS